MTDRRIVAFVPDLMDRSRLKAVPGIEFVATLDELARADADIAVVDLARPGAVDALSAINAKRVVAFGSHVQRGVLDAARATGAAEVFPRSAFFAKTKTLLQ